MTMEMLRLWRQTLTFYYWLLLFLLISVVYVYIYLLYISCLLQQLHLLQLLAAFILSCLPFYRICLSHICCLLLSKCTSRLSSASFPTASYFSFFLLFAVCFITIQIPNIICHLLLSPSCLHLLKCCLLLASAASSILQLFVTSSSYLFNFLSILLVSMNNN